MAGWLVDSSFWIAAFGRKEQDKLETVKELISSRQLYICDPVKLELMPGVRSEKDRILQEAELASLDQVITTDSAWEIAREIVFKLRSNGYAVGAMDALIAGVAIDAEVGLLHCDKDFQRIAKYFGLKEMTAA